MFKTVKRILIICLVIGAAVMIGWRTIYSSLPVVKVVCGSSLRQAEAKPLRRPGVGKIIISGPPKKEIIFSIDTNTPGIKRLNITDLTNEVKVKSYLREGSLVLQTVTAGGNAADESLVKEVLNTWGYTPYKEGPLYFRFNPSSFGKKITVDDSQLFRTEKAGDHLVQRGRLDLTTQVDPGEIEYGIVIF